MEEGPTDYASIHDPVTFGSPVVAGQKDMLRLRLTGSTAQPMSCMIC